MGCVVKIRMFRAKRKDNIDTGRHKFEKRRIGRGSYTIDTHSRKSSRKETTKRKNEKAREREREHGGWIEKPIAHKMKKTPRHPDQT